MAQADEPPRVSALARELGPPRNTAYELINTMASRNLVSLDSDGRVRLGFHLFELGSVYTQSLDLFNEARPIVQTNSCWPPTRLPTWPCSTAEQAVFLIRAGGHPVGAQPVRLRPARPSARPTAVGKAILAFCPARRRCAAWRGPGSSG